MNGTWIWAANKAGHSRDQYNQTALFRKGFTIESVSFAKISITADSWYRLRVNGTLINDGPARGWPSHYKYDSMDITSYLHTGENRIEVLARYFGTGTFHQVPQRPGLLAEISIESGNGTTVMGTDKSWEATPAPQWLRDTPKISIQMEPFEYYDARLEDYAEWAPAVEICGAHDGPWEDLSQRDCSLLSMTPVNAERILEIQSVASNTDVYCFAVARMTHPGLIEAQNNTSLPLCAATILHADGEKRIAMVSDGFRLFLNGEELIPPKRERWSFDIDALFSEATLNPGENVLLAVPRSIHGHLKDWIVAISDLDPAVRHSLETPDQWGQNDEQWCCFVAEKLAQTRDDMIFMFQEDAERDALVHEARELFEQIASSVTTPAGLAEVHSRDDITAVSNPIVTEDPHSQFMLARPVADGKINIVDAGEMLYDTPSRAVVHPVDQGDIELVLDFGCQRCGYYVFDVTAEEGVVIDIFGVEYITEDGTIQHTWANRNGLRYVCKQGINSFTSVKRRSGRYLFVRIQHAKFPIEIRRIGIIESTYPVHSTGSFRCSDQMLERIWDISKRTLVLCMEDTFTDCPLYEQTLWVGDARNEALYALYQFGAADISRRCIRIAAESLEQYPIVGCQVPSAWDCLIPVWSFLWGISVYEYVFWSGDETFLSEIWAAVWRNLENAWNMRDENGLFTGPYWNMFDWSQSDFQHHVVIHNSMFFIGALDAAERCAEILDLHDEASTLAARRTELIAAVEITWDEDKRAYPDSIHNDGAVSQVSSVHTSALSFLYDIKEASGRGVLVDTMKIPPENMVPISSPFAMMFLFEAMEKAGLHDEIVALILEHYTPMVETGSTTVWEVLPISQDHPSKFPTRSHCHAWSSSPLYFLPRTVLGIRQSEIGGSGFTVSPRVTGLEWAQGEVASIAGPVQASWRLSGQKLNIQASAPEGVRIEFEANDTWSGLTVQANGEPIA